MKVAILVSSISRNAGGLFWSVRSLSRYVNAEECAISVFAPSDEFSEQDIKDWEGLDVRVLPRRGPRAFGYAPGLAAALESAQPDIVHTHGLWMAPSVAAWRLARRSGIPLVISPRGMLDPWAVKNSAWKKRLAGVVFENGHLRQAACLHALCESEAEAFRTHGLTNPIAIIPNGVDFPKSRAVPAEPEWARGLPQGARVLLFLGRLHPKKGLSSLLRAWARVLGPFDAPWFLVIAGWDQNDHRAELEELAASLGIINTVRFVGPQFGEQKDASLRRADAFVLSSFSEGLPMAVLEAWAYRLPVIMTPQCNLPEGFVAGAAVPVDPDSESIRGGLTTFFGLSDEVRKQMGERGRQLVEERFTWSVVASEMCDMYRWVLGRGDQPSCVVLD